MFKVLPSTLLAGALLFASCGDDPASSSPSSSSTQGNSSAVSSSATAIASSDFLRVGYWPYYTEAPSDSLLKQFNHLMVFSITPSETGGIDSSFINNETVSDVVARAHALGVKVAISVGGYNLSKNFAAIATDPSKRESFAQLITNYAVAHKLDGIDMDWEYPDTTAGQAEGYRDLLGAIRRASLPHKLSLSVNVHRVSKHFANLNPDSVDWIQIMSYDQSKGMRNGLDSKGENGNYQESIEQLEFWQNRVGFPAHKIVLGMPAYGKTLKDVGLTAIDAPYRDLPDMSAESDSVLMSGDMYYLNGVGSVAKKVNYLRSKGYLGYMFWEMNQDKAGSASLFQAAKDAVK